MQVHRSGYYSYLKSVSNLPNPKEAILIAEVQELHIASRKSYGTRRIALGLQEKGYKIGRYRARSLMNKAGIECKQRRRFQVTTNSKHCYPIEKNILNREFKARTPNQVWVSDITYVWTQEGWLYLAAVLDLFSRRIVGWSVADHMREELVRNAFLMAWGRRQPETELMHHSDRGCQYASEDYRTLLDKHGITVSMSRKGNCWDNAVMERFFGSLKSECTDGQLYRTKESAKEDIINYIEMFYNSKRLHSTLGYRSPLQYENEMVA